MYEAANRRASSSVKSSICAIPAHRTSVWQFLHVREDLKAAAITETDPSAAGGTAMPEPATEQIRSPRKACGGGPKVAGACSTPIDRYGHVFLGDDYERFMDGGADSWLPGLSHLPALKKTTGCWTLVAAGGGRHSLCQFPEAVGSR